MSTTAADVLSALKQPIEHKEQVVTIDGLAWQLPRLEGVVDKIEAAILDAPAGGGAAAEALRTTALGHDRRFDVCQRYVVRAFELAATDLDGDAKKVLVAGQARLIPNGLGVTQLAFAQQASHAEVQALQAEREDVKAALALVAVHAPQVGSYLEQAIKAGRDLGQTLDAIAKVLAGSVAGSALFEARREGLSVMSHFRSTVDQLFPAGTPENDKIRSDLVGRYERLLAALLEESRRASEARPAPDAPTPS